MANNRPVTLPPPPRMLGNASIDIASQNQWCLSLYKTLVLEAGPKPAPEPHGAVTIEGADAGAMVRFEQPLDDANYEVFATIARTTGAPAPGAYAIAGIADKTPAGFALTLTAAPGAGASVTYAWTIRRAVRSFHD